LEILFEGRSIPKIAELFINGHDSGTDLLKVPIPSIFGLNFREYPHKILQKYGTNVPPLIRILKISH
jgi:hypothetical protein